MNSIFDGSLKLYYRNDQGGVLQDGPAVEWNNAMTAIEQLAGNAEAPSGSYAEQLPLGNALPTSYTVWTSPAKLLRLYEYNWTYVANSPLIATEAKLLYDENGVLMTTITDTYTYVGGVLSTVSRTIT